jgi:hypothetical protein
VGFTLPVTKQAKEQENRKLALEKITMSVNPTTPNVSPAATPAAQAKDAAPAIVTDADLMLKNEMLTAQLNVREQQLRQAIDIADRYNKETIARDEAEKNRLIDSIILDSKFGKDELKSRSLSELQTMRITLDRSIEKSFASVAAQIDEARKPKLMGVDYWDSKTGEWRTK